MAVDVPILAQEFAFGTKVLSGRVLSWSGTARRRSVDHQLLKRRGAKIEDMGPGQRRLEVELLFSGPTAVADYQDFEQYVASTPSQLLVHPVTGKWQAFCEGPTENVNLASAVDALKVRVAFKEDTPNSITPADPPDPQTAVTAASDQLAQTQQDVATYMGETAQSYTFNSDILDAINSQLTAIADLPDPVSAMNAAISSTLGAGSAIAPLLAVATKMADLSVQVQAFLDASSDLFEGSDVPVAQSIAVATLLGVVQSNADDVQTAILASQTTPGGGADAYGSVDETAIACQTVLDALQAAKPATVLYVTKRLIDVIKIAQELYPTDTNPTARASDIMAINRIPNPAAIPANTPLLVPSR